MRPSAGSALVAGFDVLREADRVRARIGVTFQEIVLDNDLTGREWTYALRSVLSTRYPTRGPEGYAHELRRLHETRPDAVRDLLARPEPVSRAAMRSTSGQPYFPVDPRWAVR